MGLNLSPEDMEKVQNNAIERYYDVVEAVRPWEARQNGTQEQPDGKDWREQYIEAFGWDPSDPEFKEWEAQQIKAFDDERQKRLTKVEVDENSLDAAMQRAHERRLERRK